MTTRTCATVACSPGYLRLCDLEDPAAEHGECRRWILPHLDRQPHSPGPDSNCTAWGRSYSQTDIDQTGKTSAAGALRNLDPSLTITH